MMKLFVLLALGLALTSSANIPKPRIIGGGQARAGQFPFSAALYVTTASGTYFCGGTLVDSQHILTAATCVDGAKLVTALLGSNSLENPDASTSLRVSTDNILIHPDWKPDSYDHNLAIIKLRLPITFTDYVKSVEFLPPTTLPEYSSVIVSGWGQIEDDIPGPVDELEFVYVTSLSNDECKLVFGNQVPENAVCIDGNYNQGICIGDIGAGLIQYVNRGHTQIVGVGSFLSGNGCESTDPSGFTRVFEYKDWIIENTVIEHPGTTTL